MKSEDTHRLETLIDRLNRILASDEWADALNPAQWTALVYIARANRFSRAPSYVAEYMCATRGTVSQTLKALAKKGLISELRSEKDKRSLSYSLTASGRHLLKRRTSREELFASLDSDTSVHLANGLEELLRASIRRRGMKAFGVCKTCRYHRRKPGGGYCELLKEQLSNREADQICHEYAESA